MYSASSHPDKVRGRGAIKKTYRRGVNHKWCICGSLCILEKSKEFPMKKFLLLFLTVALWGFSLQAEAKNDKVKYGKYIYYEGETENDVPHGQGTLVVTRLKDKSTAFISVTGTFNDKTIKNANFNATDFNALEFEGDMSFEPRGEKGKAMEIVFHLGKGDLFHDDIEYKYRKIRNISISDLVINVSATKQSEDWAIGFGPNAAQSIGFQAIVPNMPLPRNLDLLGYSPEKMKGFFADFTMNEVLVNCTEEGRFVFYDGATFCKDEIKFIDGDVVRLANNDWTGAMTYADGTHISKDNADLFKIDFKNGDSYVGTLKRNTLQDLARRGTDHPNFKYNNGVFTSEGVDEKWINGESFTHRHARLLELMREELVLAVEKDSLTEEQAIKREKELKVEDAKLAARRLQFSDDSLSIANAQCPVILGAVKGKKFSGQVKLSDEEDAATYAKKVQLWLTVSFVTANRCVLSYKGKAVAKDEDSADFIKSLEPTFIHEGNFAYRIEGYTIYLYDTKKFERQRFSFSKNKNNIYCNELKTLLNVAR